MKILVFDTSSIISLVTNNLLGTLNPLKERFRGEFYIPKSVEYELVDKPLEGKMFKLEAMMVRRAIRNKLLNVYSNEINVESLLNKVNSIYYEKGKPINIVSKAEVEALALAVNMKAEAYVVDERTMRLLVEDPEKLKLRVEELTDSLRRLQAEFENFKKRRDKEEQERMVYHDARMIEQLLPIIDTFESALKHVREVSADEKLINGVELIFGQLFSALEKQGLRSMDVVNKPFDPYKADALMQEKTAPEKDNIVLEELQKGYMFKDRVLRHAKVKVGVADKSE